MKLGAAISGNGGVIGATGAGRIFRSAFVYVRVLPDDARAGFTCAASAASDTSGDKTSLTGRRNDCALAFAGAPRHAKTVIAATESVIGVRMIFKPRLRFFYLMHPLRADRKQVRASASITNLLVSYSRGQSTLAWMEAEALPSSNDLRIYGL